MKQIRSRSAIVTLTTLFFALAIGLVGPTLGCRSAPTATATDTATVEKDAKATVDAAPTSGATLTGRTGVPAAAATGRSAAVQLKTIAMLDYYKGEHLPNNSVWPGQTVTYLSDAERTAYKLKLDDGKIYDATGTLFDTSDASSAHAGNGSAIFVIDELGNFYASKVHKVGEFHHSSLVAGQQVAAAGELVVRNGELKGFTDKSGHYRPTIDLSVQALEILEQNKIKTVGIPKTIYGKLTTP